MSDEYGNPAIVPVEFDFEQSIAESTQNCLTLTGKDLLGIVQSAFAELGSQNAQLTAVKRAVLDDVAEGRLAHALRTAIVGAGKANCT